MTLFRPPARSACCYRILIVPNIIRVDFKNPAHGQALVALLDEYASGPMGGNAPLSDYTRTHLITKLAERPDAHALLAYKNDEPAGLAILFEGFSTFACKPLLNLHDFMVAERFQRQGIARHLLKTIEEYASWLGCCKITLEVLQGNTTAQALYQNMGYAGYQLDTGTGHAMFWQRTLES